MLPLNIIYLFISTYAFLLSVLTFRSILTFPWVESGGKVNITCAKTGYNASITFHTKPFYGGKLHRVTGEVKNTSTGRVICKVNGEWNGKIEISFTSHQVCVYLKASFFKLKPYKVTLCFHKLPISLSCNTEFVVSPLGRTKNHWHQRTSSFSEESLSRINSRRVRVATLVA